MAKVFTWPYATDAIEIYDAKMDWGMRLEPWCRARL